MSGKHTIAPDTPTSAFSLSALYGIQGRTALITGGGSGLGSYAALAFALHGARVYIVGRRKEKLDNVIADFAARQKEDSAGAEAKDGKIVALPGDVSSKQGIQAIADAYGKHETHLDVLINGAGIIRTPAKVDKEDGHAVLKSLWEQDWSDFGDLFNVNVISVHYMTLAMAPYLDKAEKPSLSATGASVINIASIGRYI